MITGACSNEVKRFVNKQQTTNNKMQHPIISFQLAKILKELGYNWETMYFYEYDDTLNCLDGVTAYLKSPKQKGTYITQFCNWNQFNFDSETRLGFYSDNGTVIQDYFTMACSAPDQSQVMEWLREVHELWLSIELYADGSVNYLTCTLRDYKYKLTPLGGATSIKVINEKMVHTNTKHAFDLNYSNVEFHGITTAINYLIDLQKLK